MIEKKRKKRALHFAVTGALLVAPAFGVTGCGGEETEEPHTNVTAGDEDPNTNVAAHEEGEPHTNVAAEDEEEIPDPVDPEPTTDVTARGEGADDAADIVPGSQQDAPDEP